MQDSLGEGQGSTQWCFKRGIPVTHERVQMCFESNSLNVFLGIKLSKFLKPLEKLSISQVFSCLETVLRQVAPFLGKSEAL